MSWTQPICERCWETEQPGREPSRVRHAEVEKCCMCGGPTVAGIYIRRDPAKCRFPSAIPVADEL